MHEAAACGGGEWFDRFILKTWRLTHPRLLISPAVLAYMHVKHVFSYYWKTQIEVLQKRLLKIHRPKGGNKGRVQNTI
jgi:hypothetical protein